MNPLLYTDYYKTEHHKMYPEGTTKIYSNFTPRKSRMKGVNKVVFFGLQHFILKYLIDKFNKDFFCKHEHSWFDEDDKQQFKKDIITEYKQHINVDTKHIEALWDLGYLPIEIKALPEGSLVPIGVPCFTVENTHPDFFWLTNYLETLISCQMWQPITSATIAYEYKKLLQKYSLETTGSIEGVQWQGHDFSMRGMSSLESSILSGMGHLTSFTGTDTIPAIYSLETSYRAKGLIGASVPATEHSVMCMGTKDDEIGTFKDLLNKYPTGILSVVSDTWDLWKVCTEYLPQLKSEILARDGKLVIRPDSGDPVSIICGDLLAKGTRMPAITPVQKGVIELLWDTFGGIVNEQGYKVLDSQIGAIYGDSITLDRAREICERLKAKGFASTNIVLGIGSYTYQYNTRDTFGFAMKATYGEVLIKDSLVTNDTPGEYTYRVEAREIFKDPITDDGTKRSAKGLLKVDIDDSGDFILIDRASRTQQEEGQLKTVFLDGKLVLETTLDEIRERLK
jgi:nicotinamide phosphoribosyltransferase